MTPVDAGSCVDRSFIMLSYIWFNVRGAISSAGRYWISMTVAQRYGQTFPDDALAAHKIGSFNFGFFAVLADSEGRRLVSPWLRQFFMIGVCGGSVTLEKARVIPYRPNVEANG
jgi:fluoride ion exporter CrcB/FEX